MRQRSICNYPNISHQIQRALKTIVLSVLTIILVSTNVESSTYGCKDWLSVSTLAGRLSNNVWNKQASNGFPYKQCLNYRVINNSLQYGWSWSWPRDGTVVFAYPEIIIGSKPWEPGPGTDSRFPRKISNTPNLYVSYDIETTSSGSYNLAASMWMINKPNVTDPPNLNAIKAELMIWTQSTQGKFFPGGDKRGEVKIDGYIWEVWASENWGDSSGGNQNTWTYIAYRAKLQTTTITYDAKKMINDAVSRGLLSKDLYIADVELGNEIMSGTGSTWLKTFTVTLSPPPIVFPPPLSPPLTGAINILLGE